MAFGGKLLRALRRPSRLALRIYAVCLAQFLIVALALEVNRQANKRPEPWQRDMDFIAAGIAADLDDRRDDGGVERVRRDVARAARTFNWSLEVYDESGALVARADPPEGPIVRGPSGSVPVTFGEGRTGRVAYVIGPRPLGARGPWSEGPRPPGAPPGSGDAPPWLRDALRDPPHDAPPGPWPPGPPERGPWPGPPSDDGPKGPPEPARFGPLGPPGPLAGFPVGYLALVVLAVVGVASFITARSLTRPLAELSEVARAFGRGKLDARARMKRRDEIGELARTFDEMAERIGKLLLAERELLANVSHELRTPLARIRVALDLANEAGDGDVDPSLGEIAQDLAELERIVDDVLAAARLALQEEGRGPDSTLPMRAETIDPGALLERSVARFRAAHPARRLEVEVEAELPRLRADAVLLRRVVDNLLDNANKYTEDDDAPITLRARRAGSDLVVVVEDKGVGVAPEDLQRLFEPFFRADRSRTRATGGLGLGLALARRVVEAHGGTIRLTSELGRGTVAEVVLPVREA